MPENKLYPPEGLRPPSSFTLQSLREAMEQNTVLEDRVLRCDAGHNLLLSLGGIQARIPREEVLSPWISGAQRDIAVLSRVGKSVCFQIIGEGAGQYLFSRARVQRRALHHFLQHLAPGDVVQARVTHLEPFGAFVDVGCGVTSLIGIEHISVSRISHPAERFAVGQMVYAAVGSVDPIRARISLTHRELLGTWLENASRFAPGETVSGIVRGNEDYGIFVELAPNLSGLAERKEGIPDGAGVSVYIKSIIPDKMKVKLIVIDTLEQAPWALIRPEDYRITGGHLEHWRYSPPDKNGKITETWFGGQS